MFALVLLNRRRKFVCGFTLQFFQRDSFGQLPAAVNVAPRDKLQNFGKLFPIQRERWNGKLEALAVELVHAFVIRMRNAGLIPAVARWHCAHSERAPGELMLIECQLRHLRAPSIRGRIRSTSTAYRVPRCESENYIPGNALGHACWRTHG